MIFKTILQFKLMVAVLVLCYLVTAHGAAISESDRNVTSAEAVEPEESSETLSDAANETSSEKTDVQPTEDASLSVWGILRDVWNWIKDDISESLLGDDSSAVAAGDGRTFGRIRRLQMALIPIMFKFGVLFAMVSFLVMIAIKTLFLIKFLLMLNGAVILAKLLASKTGFHHDQPVWGWSPHVSSGWTVASPPADPVHPSKEIHLHIHGAQAVEPHVSSYSTYGSAPHIQHGWDRKSDPYGAYEPTAIRSRRDLHSEARPLITRIT